MHNKNEKRIQKCSTENIKRTSLARTKRRWKDNIKTDHQNINFELWNGFIWLRIGSLER
jgi:hypothetical protein